MVPTLAIWSIWGPWVQHMYRDRYPSELQTCRGRSVRLGNSLHRAESPWHVHGLRAHGPNIAIEASNSKIVALSGTPRRGREISFKRHPPRVIPANNRGTQEDPCPGAVLLGTTFQNCRGVPFKERKSLVGCRLKDSSKIGGSKGGRGVGGLGKPTKQDLKRRGSAD